MMRSTTEPHPIMMEQLNQLDQLQRPGEPDLIRELAECFFAAGPDKIARIRTGIEEGNVKTTQREAHSLKSTCQNVGAMHAAGFCAQLEESNHSHDDRQQLLRELEKAFQEAATELKSIIEKRSRSA